MKRSNDQGLDLEPLSITKDRGVIRQSEKYKKRIATNPLKYVIGQDGDFAFDPMSLYYGAIGRIDGLGRGLISPDYVTFVADDTVDHEFLAALLRYPEMHKKYESLSETGNSFGKRRRLYWSIFENIRLNLPPLPEQRQIAAILSAVDDAIEATQAVNDQLQVVKEAMLAELLTRGIPGRHARFKMTELGEVPEGWEVKPLGALLLGIDAGWSPQCETRAAKADEWGILKVSAVSWGEFRPDENKVLPEGLAPREQIEVRVGDVLVSRANTPELVGRAVIVRRTRPHLMLSDKILRLRANELESVPAYLNLVLASRGSRAQIEDGATGSSRSMKNISQGKLKAVRVQCPPLPEQREIAGLIEAIAERIALEEAYVAELATVKDALRSVLLTGEIRVRTRKDAA